MGYTKVKGTVSNPRGNRALEVEFLVDTGAGHMVMPPEIARHLGLEVLARTKATLANKVEVEADLSLVNIRVMDREAPVPVLLMDSPMPLIGAFTLEVLGLEVDPVRGEVRPSRPFALGLLACWKRS